MFKTKTLHLKTKTFLWCILETDRKPFFIFSRKQKCWRKWNSIYDRKPKENESGHSFSAEKRKRKSPDNTNVFFSFSYIQSPSQHYNAPPIPHPVSPFLQVVLVDGIPFSSCTVLRCHLCGIFLDDISTHEQFAFLVCCYRLKTIFHNLCTVLYWCLCGLTNSPIVKTEAHVHGAQNVRRFSQTMASKWQTAFVVSHKMPWCALIIAVKNYNKSLEKLQDFFFKTETKTKTKCSRPGPRLSFLSSRRLETKTLVSRTSSLIVAY